MKKLVSSFKRQKQLTFVITSLLILVLLSISPVAASVSSWDFSPQNPASGDTLDLKGSASPGDKVDIFVNFEKTVPVSGGKFEYILDNVKIPEGSKNSFKVEASGAKKLNVRVKMVIWITKSSDASGNTATVSQSNVPPGTYTIRIDGDAGEGVSEVNLKITAFQEIEADSNGDFSYSYNTGSIPPGNFEIKVGGIAKEINVQPKGTSGLTSGLTSSSTSGSGSTSGSNLTDSSSEKTDRTNTQSNKNSDSTSASSTAGSSPAKTGSSLQPGTSKTQDEVVSGASNPNKGLEEKDTQKQLSGEDVKTSNSSKPSVDVFYLLVGIGAGILILIMYTLKNGTKKE